MGYVTPPTFTDIDATAADGNVYIRDNQLALKDPPSQNYEANEGTNYTRTGSSAWADVDTDFNFSITTTGGDVLISFIGNAVRSGGGVNQLQLFDVSVNSTRIINQTDAGLAMFSNVVTLIQFSRRVTGLAAGTHTFNLQWRSNDAAATMTLYAGAGTASYDTRPQFWVRELS
jgi:hypothetical protein